VARLNKTLAVHNNDNFRPRPMSDSEHLSEEKNMQTVLIKSFVWFATMFFGGIGVVFLFFGLGDSFEKDLAGLGATMIAAALLGTWYAGKEVARIEASTEG